MSSRIPGGVSNGRETKSGRGELTSRSGNGEFRFQRRPLETVLQQRRQILSQIAAELYS